ncbi:polyphosphate kinase 2 family protein [Aquabacterium sp. A7-Y]|uniref:polyphosphate kinase 2 family protein n=1 Tax=Aquabacterium sp. A7-Y TaxID=1349605 RepID=UPI00223DE9E2|nr:polyphosphate kinase 2 family protein [Aquabacterium sp. A7-Y]MCW7537269.1 polyphosphate kinase 2 family protein [Aquabacterium sp. A7-Y]
MAKSDKNRENNTGVDAARNKTGEPLRAWQVGPDGVSAKDFRLGSMDPGAKPFSQGDKASDRAALGEQAQRLDELQDLLYADGRFKLLVVLQGMDTSGKDGTLRDVFGRMSPQGVHSVSFKAPSSEELAHDFLWRVHAKVPRTGELVVFNRSHYEDVLVPRVRGWIDAAELQRRYRQINDFERLLTETGTVVVKCFLHISKAEQLRRLQSRLDDPAKHWKFDLADVEARKQWDDYQRAYEDAIAATGTAWAPWTVVPADSKSHRNLMVATLIEQTLQRMQLRHPPPAPGLKDLVLT